MKDRQNLVIMEQERNVRIVVSVIFMLIGLIISLSLVLLNVHYSITLLLGISSLTSPILALRLQSRLHARSSSKQTKIIPQNKLLPSKLSLFFAASLCKPEDREFIIDDIEERFKKDVKKRGLRWAKWMLWRDNLVGLWSAIGAKTIKGLKWAGLGYLVEKILLK
jgi:hypothetical protein